MLAPARFESRPAAARATPPEAPRNARRERRADSIALSCRRVSAVSDRVGFTCDDTPVDVGITEGESLLTVLRERLGVTSVKDGCAPQGQCGCCTVLVDGEPRVACVTPAARVQGRSVTTVGGLDAGVRDGLAGAFVACGASQCGFCTPGIVVRAAALLGKQRGGRVALDRALAAHLCRCTGWQTIYDAIGLAADPDDAGLARDLDA